MSYFQSVDKLHRSFVKYVFIFHNWSTILLFSEFIMSWIIMFFGVQSYEKKTLLLLPRFMLGPAILLIFGRTYLVKLEISARTADKACLKLFPTVSRNGSRGKCMFCNHHFQSHLIWQQCTLWGRTVHFRPAFGHYRSERSKGRSNGKTLTTHLCMFRTVWSTEY